MNHALTKNIVIICIILLAISFRFYNLTWGSPYYFHPDERQNIVYPVISSNSLFMFDQKIFDNGTFPLLIMRLIFVFFTTVLHTTMDQTVLGIIISRSLSALISCLLLLLLLWVGKTIWNRTKGFLIFSFAAFSIGFIQFSHFGTIEIWEAFFFFLLFYLSWRIAENGSNIDSFICGIVLGVSISTKVLSIILIPAILSAYIIFTYQQIKIQKSYKKTFRRLFLILFIFSISTLCTFLITFSQIFTNYTSVYNGIHFESNVALGKTPTFYTQGFYHTTPLLYQFLHVYPFLLNPFITILFLFSFLYVSGISIFKKKYSYLLVIIFFLITFVSQAVFFVKWTRYMIPTLPFIYCILGIAIDDWSRYLSLKFHHKNLFTTILIVLPLCICFVTAVSYFITVYVKQNSLIVASYFAQQHIPQQSQILTESFDLGGTAFTSFFPNITGFDFYNLDNTTFGDSATRLAYLLNSSSYILLPSQRLTRTRLPNNSDFKEGHNFYTRLFNGALGFSLIYQTSCDLLCTIAFSNNPTYYLEETATVFDRPTVFIFKKIHTLTQEQYLNLIR